MPPAVTISAALPPRPDLVPPPAEVALVVRRHLRLRGLAVTALTLMAFLAVAGQLVRLAMKGAPEVSTSMSEPIATTFARPDIVDRNGRLIATDVEVHSLFADPALILDRDEVVEKLASVLPDLDEEEVRRLLADRNRRFAWIRRGLSPKLAQEVHNLGLPGLSFRKELKRAYPAGNLAGHLLGFVNIDNKGLSGLERHLDDSGAVEPVHGGGHSDRAPVRLSIDMGAQHALEEELRGARQRYGAAGAAGLVLDVKTGEVMASASMPDIDPARPASAHGPEHINRVLTGTYELGSIFKTVTIAMSIDAGLADLSRVLDVREPLTAGRFTIKDLHAAGRPLTVAEVFTHSSNVGAGMLALEAGTERQRAFLHRLGLLDGAKTEAGPVAAPQLPERWERAETITISYGHGLAVAPLQFASAAAALINGGELVQPTLLRRLPGAEVSRTRVLAPETSARIRELMRLNVTDAAGTGRRAEVPGYQVGGKTGTAELPGRGGYQSHAVIASFLGAFPMRDPRFVTLVMLFEPKPTAETKNQVLAGLNAAPTTARLVERIAPLLGVLPAGTEALPAGDFETFDAP